MSGLDPSHTDEWMRTKVTSQMSLQFRFLNHNIDFVPTSVEFILYPQVAADLFGIPEYDQATKREVDRPLLVPPQYLFRARLSIGTKLGKLVRGSFTDGLLRHMLI